MSCTPCPKTNPRSNSRPFYRISSGEASAGFTRMAGHSTIRSRNRCWTWTSKRRPTSWSIVSRLLPTYGSGSSIRLRSASVKIMARSFCRSWNRLREMAPCRAKDNIASRSRLSVRSAASVMKIRNRNFSPLTIPLARALDARDSVTRLISIRI